MDEDLTERIRQRAYSLWEQNGKPEDQAHEFWMRAERELTASERDNSPSSLTGELGGEAPGVEIGIPPQAPASLAGS